VSFSPECSRVTSANLAPVASGPGLFVGRYRLAVIESQRFYGLMVPLSAGYSRSRRTGQKRKLAGAFRLTPAERIGLNTAHYSTH
jgi:hypothetical protein